MTHALSIRTWHNHLHLMHTHHELQTTNRTPALNDREKLTSSQSHTSKATELNRIIKKKMKNKIQPKIIHFLRRCFFPCVWKFGCVLFGVVLYCFFRYSSTSPCSPLTFSGGFFFSLSRSIIQFVSGMVLLNCPICLTDSIVARHSVFLKLPVTSLFLFFCRIPFFTLLCYSITLSAFHYREKEKKKDFFLIKCVFFAHRK